MSFKKYIRKNIYRWHRISSLFVAVPVLMWSLSGFLHPVMSSFKPDVRNQFLAATSIHTLTGCRMYWTKKQKSPVSINYKIQLYEVNFKS
jgi:hypothetical protein